MSGDATRDGKVRADGAAPDAVCEIGTAVPKAPAGKRYAGYCRKCHGFVELGPTFTCMKGGHPKGDIAVALLLDKDEPLPRFPKVNVGALFMPALWGPLHGQVFTVLFYPIWLFMDNVIYTCVHGATVATVLLTVVAGLALAAFTVAYAMRADEMGYLRVAAEKTPEEYLRGERKWTVMLVLIAVAFLVFASWYNLAIRPGLPVE